MTKVIITRGLPGSGKTTWAKSMQRKYPGKYIRLNKDDLRVMLHNNTHNEPEFRTQEMETFIHKARNALLEIALAEGKDIIIDDTNLNPEYIETIKQIVGDKAEIEFKDFTNISLEECLKRNEQREKKVHEEVIHGMYDKYLKTEKKI